MRFDEILARFSDVKQSGNGWIAKCAAHDDGTASVSISKGSDGRALIHCHAGCTVEAVCTALGLTLSDLFPPKETRNGKHIVAIYDYHDASGKVVFQVVRFEPKDFRQRKPDTTAPDGWTWSTKGVEKVLFRLPEINRAIAGGKFIFLTEGERDALTMVQHGFDATCNPGGAGKWLDSYTETLRGADVVIIADKDAPGRAHAQLVAGKLHGVAKSVRVLELPDTNGKPVKDAADFFAAGGTREDLIALVDAVPQWTLPGNDDPPEPATPQPPAAKSLGAFIRYTENDPDELLKCRYLSRKGSLLLVGPTGIGKSSLSMQAAILWGIGRDCFGIIPVCPLKSLIIQAEDDDGDIAEMRDGVIAGLNLSEQERQLAFKNVIIVHESSRVLKPFMDYTVAPLLELYRPDFLWINPALSTSAVT